MDPFHCFGFCPKARQFYARWRGVGVGGSQGSCRFPLVCSGATWRNEGQAEREATAHHKHACLYAKSLQSCPTLCDSVDLRPHNIITWTTTIITAFSNPIGSLEDSQRSRTFTTILRLLIRGGGPGRGEEEKDTEIRQTGKVRYCFTNK